MLNLKHIVLYWCLSSIAVALPHHTILDSKGEIQIQWGFDNRDITFKVTAETHGWFGIGMSPSGDMKYADIFFMWVTDGNVQLLDMFSRSNSVPKLDGSQDLILVNGFANNTHSSVTFTRRLITCDKMDVAITEDTMRIIWAFGYNKPLEKYPTIYDKHDHVRRGSRSLRLLNNRKPTRLHHQQVKTFDIRSKKVFIPPVHTYYHCRIVQLKDYGGHKQHIVQVDPVIEPGNERFVHHMILYMCVDVKFTEHSDRYGESCYSNMPQDYMDCMTPIGGWAIGGTSFSYPDNVGLPMELKNEDHNMYFMIEIHYDNPTMREDIVDSSGLRLHYTPKLRTYDAGVLLAGHTVTPLQIVPAKSTEWVTQGHCTQQCTNELFRESESNIVQVFATHLHSHTSGRKMKFRIFRENNELRPLQTDNHYDVNYQEIQLLHHHATIAKGDRMLVECVYNTSDRDYVTFGGLASANEMCLGFLWYYPKSNLQTCTSAPTAGGIYRAVGTDVNLLDNIDPYEPWVSRVGQKSLRTVIKSNWTDKERQNLNKRVLETPIMYECKTDKGFIMSHSRVEPIKENFIPEDVCGSRINMKVYNLMHVTIGFLIVLTFSIGLSYLCFKIFRKKY